MRNHLLTLFMTLVLTALGPLAAFAADASKDSLSAVLAEVIAPPNPVLGADDLVHLAYEIRVTNQSPLIVTIEEVEALDGDTGDVIARLGVEHLKQLYRPATGDGGQVVQGGQNGVLFMDVALPKADALPMALRHRFHIALSGMEGVPPEITFTTEATPVGQSRPSSLRRRSQGQGLGRRRRLLRHRHVAPRRSVGDRRQILRRGAFRHRFCPDQRHGSDV